MPKQDFETRIYHHHQKGGCFSVQMIEEEPFCDMETPWLCIVEDDDIVPVASFVSIDLAEEFCNFFGNMLNCKPIVTN